MKLWQRLMIRLARSSRMKRVMQRRASLSALSRRFVGGSDIGEATETCMSLRASGIRASLFYLGEYVSDPEEVRRTVEEKMEATRSLAGAGLDVHVSVDPTQIGHLLSREAARENAHAIARALSEAARGKSRSGVDVLMLDMEDETLVGDTIALHQKLAAEGLPVGLTLQAYLRRTEGDLEALVSVRNTVRLVKGAFAAGPDIAFTRRSQVRESFLRLAALMLSRPARAAGFYPVFATHDHGLIAELVKLAVSGGWQQGMYEFEMLYGVRPELQVALARNGHRVRRVGGPTALMG